MERAIGRGSSKTQSPAEKAAEQSGEKLEAGGNLNLSSARPGLPPASRSSNTGSSYEGSSSPGMSAADIQAAMSTARRKENDNKTRAEAINGDKAKAPNTPKPPSSKIADVRPESVAKEATEKTGKQFAKPGETVSIPSQSFDEDKKSKRRKRAEIKNSLKPDKNAKQFREESSPKAKENPAKATNTKQQHGPAIPVNKEGKIPGPHVTYAHSGQNRGNALPINALAKIASDAVTDLVPVNKNKSLRDDPNRARTVIGPSPFVTEMPEHQAGTRLLPGNSLPIYRWNRELENQGLTDDQLILDSVNEAFENMNLDHMYPKERKAKTDDVISLKEYEEDYRSGNIDSDKYTQRMSTRQKRAAESSNKAAEYYKRGFIPLKSQHRNEDGSIGYEEETETKIAEYMAFMKYPPEYQFMVFKQVMKELGFSPDRNGKFLGMDEADFKMDDAVFRQALDNMMLSSKKFGTPYRMLNTSFIYGGTRCIPISIIDEYEAKIMCESNPDMFGTDPYKLMEKAQNDWMNENLPTIRRNVLRQDNGEAQMAVIEDMVRGISGLIGVNSKLYGVSDYISRSFDDFMSREDVSNYPNPDKDDRDICEYKQKEAMRARKILDTRKFKQKKVYSQDIVEGQEGEARFNFNNITEVHRKGTRVMPWHQVSSSDYELIQDARNGKIEAFFMTTSAIARFNGIIMNVPIILSGMAEHLQGNILTKISNQLMLGGLNSEYRPTTQMISMITSDEGVDAIAAWKALLTVGGQEAVMLFNQEYNVLNKENAKKFLDDYVNRETSKQKRVKELRSEINQLRRKDPNSSKLEEMEAEYIKLVTKAQKSKKIKDRLDSVTNLLLPGDLGFGKADARRWLEGFMVNNRDNNISNKAKERGFTAAEIQEMMGAGNISGFLASVTSTNAGRDAMLMTRDQTLARETPLTHAVDVILRRSGVTDFAITMFVDTYFKYGLNLIQLMIPMSNTLSYLAVKGVNTTYKNFNESGESNLDINALNYQMGGNDAFLRGLRKNLIYDVVKLSNMTAITGFLCLVLLALGFDEPEEGLKYNWNEYRVGGNIGVVGPDGKPGVPVYAAWWINDLTLFGLPAAYALAAQIKHPGDYDLTNKLFVGGCYDMVSGASLLDMCSLINNASRDFQILEQSISDPDVKKPEDWDSYSLQEVKLLMMPELAVAGAAKKMIPSFMTNWMTDTAIVGEQALDRSAYNVYNRDSKTPGSTKHVDDPYEELRRIESKFNPLYALWNNRTKNGYFFDDGTTEKTGYLLWEMPINTTYDEEEISFASQFEYDPDNIPGGEENRIQYTEDKINEVLKYIDKEKYPDTAFNSPEEAANNGFMIPFALRAKMRDYCYQHINAAENIYNDNVQNGLYVNSAAKTAGYTEMDNTKQYYWNILNNWVFNENIPWSSKAYAKILSDNQIVYTFKNGEPASIIDYWQYGEDIVDKQYVPKGNHPTSYAPFTIADGTGNRGYNFETVSRWNAEGESGTDLDKIFERNKKLNAKVPEGYRNAGVETNAAVFGGNRAVPGGESTEYGAKNKPTMGQRSWIPFTQSLLNDLPNTKNVWGQKISGSSDSTSDNSSNGSSNGSGSGSGSDSMYDGINAIAELKSVGRENVGDDSSLGELGKYRDSDSWKTKSSPNWSNSNWNYSSGKRSYSSGGSGSSYSPKIYSNPRSINADKAATMYTKQPYSANINSYLRPNFATKGSREAYKRSDI